MKKILIFLLLLNIAHAAKYQFFLGLGASMNEGKLSTTASNQYTRNTSTVNETGNLFYTNTQHGSYENGNVKDITSGYAGLEVTIDKAGIFTVRGYVSASFSNSVDFGTLDKNSLHDGSMRKCNAGEMPNLNVQCWRDEFYNSNANGATTPVKFNANPGFSDTISNNAFMLTYGVGVDVGVNLPISFVWKKLTKYKMVGFRVGVYGGVGYEFTTYSLGKFDNRTYNNTTSGGVTWRPDPGVTAYTPGTTLNTQDSLYISGAGMYGRAGLSLYFTDNLRLDFGLKIPITFAGVPNARSQKWYLKEHYSLPAGQSDPFTQQLLIQNYNVQIGIQWHFSANVLF
ncbi:hypothetical protein DCO58_05055 [Helicobacter saguini]|uniref:Outer membrane protein n=1 Tax=Helicobacter saguini TaxID=1548018 RepID=A0A4U8T670_9HELI|nr:outer membrane beta-barrel protein [Helicobacter saguini]MWV67045.1 hypothetical protein [Helicobacter saguini]TLD95045.1 hypothetical protein LS64_003815 [Helicobacter saguini]